MNPIALFFTAGISDIKFVAEDGTLLELAKLRGKPEAFASIRQVHDALLSAHIEKKIALFPFDKLPKEAIIGKGRRDVSFLSASNLLETNPVTSDMENCPLQRLPDGRLLLAADKLVPVWEEIRAKKVAAIVGFGTRRDKREDEPVAAEALILDKLVAALNPKHSKLITYVQGDETLESGDGNFSLLAQSRIEDGVRACREALGAEKVESWLATSGGVPAVKDVLRAALELHFGKTRSILQREGGATANFRRAPQDSLVARRHALDFVRRGALIEASAIASPFRDDEQALALWVQPLCCAARLLYDNPLTAYASGKHPNSADDWERKLAPPQFLQQIARIAVPGKTSPKLRCLLPGLRADAALLSGKWLEAINLTVTFFDAALRDSVERKLGGLFQNDRVIRLTRSLGDDDRKTLIETPCWPDERPCLSPVNGAGNLFYFQSSKTHDDAWSKYVGGALQELNARLNAETGANKPTLRDIRNRNTHNILSDKEIKAGRQAFIQQGLWERPDGKSHLSLLDGALGKEVLEELDYTGANPLTQIISNLEDRLKGKTTGVP